MVFPDASGVMFTADVVNGNRKVVCIDASFGLGEAIVSGMVSADMYRIKNEKIIETKISDKKIAIYSVPTGGTVTRDLDEEQRHKQVLKDNEIIALSQVGLSIQKHYGIPQDIEWCLVGNEIFIVQSRPITSLYPLPPKSDNRYHIYSSFGHMQMMTDPMKPLGLSTIRTVVPIGNRDEPYGESTAFVDIGNRLYIDWTDYLYRPIGKIASVLVSNADERASNAVREAGETPEYKANQKSGSIVPAWNAVVYAVTFFSQVFLNLFVRDRSHVVEETNAKVSKILAVHGHYDSYEGEEKVRQIQHHLSYFFPTLLCSIAPAMFAGIISMRITESLVKKWLGDAVNPSLLNKGLRGNITTEMGLRVGDLADIARQHPQLVEFLESTTTLDGIEQVDGGIEFKEELDDFLAVHGCRGPGEIDITRTRWSEDPMLFVPSIIGQVKGLNHGEHRIKHEQGAKEAEQTEATILDLVRRTRFGYIKSLLLSRTLHVYRNSVGVREHPKFTIVTIFGRIRNAILEMADELVERDIINDRSDIFYFRLEEIAALVGDRYNFDAKARVEERREQYERNKKLAPPRVMNSDGEIFNGARKDVIVPEGAIAGLAVSAGIVEGVARVMQTPNDSTFLPGEILVAPYTDPAWTTLFNSAAGLITEVGGLLTHGSVVAREYGIPAVVGIDNATTLIKTGDRIFLDGTTGYIKILPSK
jgi:pyruvate,water dikinase